MQTTEKSLYLDDIQDWFRMTKSQADRAIEQVDDEMFFGTLTADSNSIAVLVKHLAGNMRSRWRDFLTSDGEKPDRRRDLEFVIEAGDTREALMLRWEEAWRTLFETLDTLTDGDLSESVLIRSEPYGIMRAINRQLQHYAYHVGQIVLLAKIARGPAWQTLSIARGESEQYNQQMRSAHQT